MSVLARLIETRGDFKHKEATAALTEPYPEKTQAVALWLRRELKKLREGERAIGVAPVLKGDALSRLDIADIAMTMLESLSDEVGGELVCLFQELLDVDRHRKALFENRSAQFELAAALEGQGALQGRTFGVRELARIVDVSAATVTTWRRSTAYRDAVETEKRLWGLALREQYFDKIKAENPDLTDEQAFVRAFQMYGEDLPRRRSKWSECARDADEVVAGPKNE